MVQFTTARLREFGKERSSSLALVRQSAALLGPTSTTFQSPGWNAPLAVVDCLESAEPADPDHQNHI